MMGTNALIKGMLPPEFTIRALMWHDDPEFADFPQESMDLIANACAGVDIQKISDEKMQLSSPTLQDERLLQTFQNQHPNLFDS